LFLARYSWREQQHNWPLSDTCLSRAWLDDYFFYNGIRPGWQTGGTDASTLAIPGNDPGGHLRRKGDSTRVSTPLRFTVVSSHLVSSVLPGLGGDSPGVGAIFAEACLSRLRVAIELDFSELVPVVLFSTKFFEV